MIDHTRLKAMLTRHEGVRRLAYDDATGHTLRPGDQLKGHPTIGVGRALDVNGISDDEIDFMLDNDVHNCVVVASALGSLEFKALSVARQDVVVAMIFQMGLGGFLRFKDMLSALGRQDFEAAADAMMASHWATVQAPERAEELAYIMRTDRYAVE